MKYLSFLILILPMWLHAQNISVQSFKVLTDDMDARVSSPKQDQNGEIFAIIKVVSTQQGFIFEGGMNEIVSTEYKTGDYWLYVPHNFSM